MQILKNIVLSLPLILVLSGCTLKPGLYKPDFNSINELKELNVKSLAVAPTSYQNKWAATQEVEEVNVRGGRLVSPYGETFAEYLKVSLEEHLKSANLYDPTSSLIISAVLLQNEVHANGVITGNADISAKFIVRQGDNTIYEKIHTIHHEWDSSFLAAVAVPNALANYPIAMQKLINSLMSDKDFIESIKR